MYQVALNHDNDGLVLFFFISFMQMTNLLFLNIIIALVIDTYTSIEETLQQEKQQLLLSQPSDKLLGKGKDGDQAQAKSLLRELNDNPGQFTRIMQILNVKRDEGGEDESPASNSIRISDASTAGKGSMASFRSAVLSENAKQQRLHNA